MMSKLNGVYYEVIVSKTGKPMGRTTEGYSRFDDQRLTFRALTEVKAWLKKTYGNCKRLKMYRDLATGEGQQIGWVYCFKNADWSHAPVQNWWQQDWVQVNKIKAIPILT